MCESWSAFVCRRQFPALVTKTSGTTNCPWESTNFSKAFLAAGIGSLPRTSTPSMSKSSPKRGCGCRRNQTRYPRQTCTDVIDRLGPDLSSTLAVISQSRHNVDPFFFSFQHTGPCQPVQPQQENRHCVHGVWFHSHKSMINNHWATAQETPSVFFWTCLRPVSDPFTRTAASVWEVSNTGGQPGGQPWRDPHR